MIKRHRQLAVGAFAMAASALMAGSASAADLGGNCCADLEERIAELEATTARKGNRKVSLTVSGQVHTGVLFFDDGVETNAFITDNDNTSSRFRFLGNAKIDANWSAGYLLEIETEGAPSNLVTQLNDDGVASNILLRHSAWWIDHKQLGRVWVGQTSPATDDIILADAAGAGPAAFSDQLIGNSLFFRNSAGQLTNLQTNVVSNGSFDTARRNLVRYDTPTIQGFRATATWGEDDFWDVALWYAGKVGDLKIVGGIGYFEDTDLPNTVGTAQPGNESFSEFKGSISILHEPSGLFGSFAFVDRDFELNAGADPRNAGMEYYYFNGGIVLPKLLPVGKTVLYGEYGIADGVSAQPVTVGGAAGTAGAALAAAGVINVGTITSAELETFGFGVVQHVSPAELEIYALFKQFDLDARTATAAVNTQEINIVYTGARIKF